MERWVLFDSEVHHFEDWLIAHVGLVNPFLFGVLLAVSQNIFPDFTKAVISKLLDEATETISGIVQSLKMLVGVLDSLGRGLLWAGKLLFASIQHIPINFWPLGLEELHLSNVGQNNIYSLNRLNGAFTLTTDNCLFSSWPLKLSG
jgi:hypothetical protein